MLSYLNSLLYTTKYQCIDQGCEMLQQPILYMSDLPEFGELWYESLLAKSSVYKLNHKSKDVVVGE